MPRPGRKLHLLRRPKLRQSWNKYNLFNISQTRDPKIGLSDNETFFQQKWRAKGILRGYHGAHIKEGDWERMFSRRLLSVVNMNPRYMAEFDGSERASGRGSGKEKIPKWDEERINVEATTPYMNMTFAPMERRLDIAVFRAMFASSARQARQFVVHGAVKVNGKVTPYPSYKLNPGDMFQVQPEKVMFATGETKDPNRLKKNAKRKARAARRRKEGEDDASEEPVAAAPVETPQETLQETPQDEEAAEILAAPEQDPDTTDKPEAPPPDMRKTRKAIQTLATQAKTIIAEESLSAPAKQTLRAFLKRSKVVLSKAGRPTATPNDIANELNAMMTELNLVETPEAASGQNEEEAAAPKTLQELLTPEQIKDLERRMLAEAENPYDPDKPYRTPWRPKPFMSPFAYIPQYLEVNQNVCSAVYLRHPVARVGSAEVPTPFPPQVSQMAFNWYLRRR